MIYNFSSFIGQCDECDKVFVDDFGDSQFNGEDDLIELMIHNGWKVEDIQHVYCPICKKEEIKL